MREVSSIRDDDFAQAFGEKSLPAFSQVNANTFILDTMDIERWHFKNVPDFPCTASLA